MGSAKGMMPKKAAPKHKVSHIHIERAGNGVTVRHRQMIPAQRHPGGGMMPSEISRESEPQVFNKPGQAKKHVAGLMAQMMPQDNDNDDMPPEAA